MATAVTDRAEWRSEQGLTLLELVVGLGLLGIASLSLLNLVVLAIQLNDLSEERSIATSIAVDRVAMITSLPFRGVTDVAEYALPEEALDTGPPPTFSTDYGAISGYPDYRRVIELHYDVPAPGMLAVEVQVFWRRPGGSERSHSMVTYIHPALE